MEQKAVCGGFLVGDGLEMNGKVLSATGGGGKLYTNIGDIEGYHIAEAGADIESIIANGGLTIHYENGDYTRLTFAFTVQDFTYGLEYDFIDYAFDDGEVQLYLIKFVIDGNDLLERIEEP